MSFADKTLTCRDCGQEFIWTAGEQEFYASRGLQNPPSRCPADRAARRAGGGGGGGGGGVGVGDGSCGPGGFVIFVIGDDADNSVSNVKPFSTFAFPGACTEKFSSVASGKVWADGNRFARPGLSMK